MKHLTDANFKAEVLDKKGVALVDFYADWCGPCKMLGPVIEDVAKDMESDNDVLVAKVNVDSEQETAGSYGIMSIPTVIVFKDGKPVKQMVGVQSKDAYKKEIEEAKK
jgi:thioredoxin 1